MTEELTAIRLTDDEEATDGDALTHCCATYPCSTGLRLTT